ncbi:MAG: cytidine deaminase [Ferruginibacter sp.]|nr:cytidine deaminase [Ferruginibacter sp.]
MQKKEHQFSYTVFPSIDGLNESDAMLLNKAKAVTAKAYAPYSNFKVGAAALLNNGKILEGTNQENASYPVTICAERTLLAAISSLYNEEPIKTMAISYDSKKSDKPITPCGVCRQMLAEYEERTKQPIRLILGGMTGEVYIIEKATDLLPFTFTSDNLK